MDNWYLLCESFEGCQITVASSGAARTSIYLYENVYNDSISNSIPIKVTNFSYTRRTRGSEWCVDPWHLVHHFF